MVDPVPLRPGENEGVGDGAAPPTQAPLQGGGGGGSISPPVTRADLDRLHAWIRLELLGQAILIVGLMAAIYFGTVASNQASGSLGMSLGQAVEQSRTAFREDMIRELDRREAERERQDRQPQEQQNGQR